MLALSEKDLTDLQTVLSKIIVTGSNGSRNNELFNFHCIVCNAHLYSTSSKGKFFTSANLKHKADCAAKNLIDKFA